MWSGNWIVWFGDESERFGVSCELFHEAVKINKQFNYAEKKNIAYAAIIGSKEIEQKYCLVKDLKTGLQEVVVFDNLAAFFHNK